MAIYIALSTTLEHVSSSKFTKPSSNPRRITNTACGFEPGIVNYKKGALDSQPQVIKFTSCLPMVGGSLRVLRP